VGEIRYSSDYEILEVPGSSGLKIAVIPAMNHNETDEGTDVRRSEWTFSFVEFSSGLLAIAESAIMSFLNPGSSMEIFGWHAETTRETGADVGHQLFTSASIRHSELTIVALVNQTFASFENKMATGTPIKTALIIRTTRMFGLPIDTPIQINTFNDCYITSVQQYLDYMIIKMRISSKSVKCIAFRQDGFPMGIGFFEVDFEQNKSTGSTAATAGITSAASAVAGQVKNLFESITSGAF
jgi:hypothetical protein